MKKRSLYIGLDPSHFLTKNEIVHCPFIEIKPRPLSDPLVQLALSKFSNYTHILITSKSTVKILSEYIDDFGISLNEWKKKKNCVVGKVTAKHLIQTGIEPFLIAQNETAEGLIEALKPLCKQNQYAFWPHSSQARPLLTTFIEETFPAYFCCPFYDTDKKSLIECPPLHLFDEVIMTSPTTVKAFFDHFPSTPDHLKMVPIGPITKAYLHSLIHM